MTIIVIIMVGQVIQWMKLSLVTSGISTGAGAVVELQDPHRALMADLSSVNEILHLSQVITRE